MNATARILTAAPEPTREPEPAVEPEPAQDVDPMVARIAAHAAAATAPVRLVRNPDPAVVARVGRQARLDAVGLPRALYRIEDV